MKVPTVSWGIIGCGWVAQDYVAPVFKVINEARLAACCDPDRTALQSLGETHPNAELFTDLSKMLQLPEIDAVYIATPNWTHCEITEKAAVAGKHVLCEKPMATCFSDAAQMVKACELAGVRYATAFDQRFQARHVRLAEIIKEGRLGQVTVAEICYSCWLPPGWLPRPGFNSSDNWRIDPQKSGGGAFVDLATHGIDLLQMLLDERIIDLKAFIQTQVFDYQVDDGAVYIGRTASGILVHGTVAFNCPEQFPRRRLEIRGTRACAIAVDTMGQTPGGRLSIIDAETGSVQEVEIESDVSPFQRSIELFTYSLQTGKQFPFSPELDLHTMKLVSEALE